jgi:tetratricopeptide (TPR) repeat protein
LQESLDRAAALGDDALQLDAALQLIDVNAALERTDAALEAGSLARALAERTHASPDRVVDLLGSEAMALPLERRADRVQRLEEALAICREHPGQFEGALASVLSNLSNALPVAEADRAHALAMEALEIRQRLAVDSDDGATDGAEVVVAQAEGMRGDFEACVRRAAGVYGRAERPLIRARAARAVAVCMTDLGDPAGAVPWADRSLDEAARTHSRDSLQYAEKLEFKGALLARANEYEAAAAADQQAVAILEVQSRRPSNRVAMAYVNLSTTLQKLGEHRRAEVYARKGLEEAEAVDDPALVRDAHVAMGEALGNIGRYAEAIRHLEVAAGDPPYDERALVARAVYAVAMWNTGRREAGMRIARETASQLEDGKSSSTRQALENWIEKHAGSVATGDQVDLRQPAAGAIEGDAGAAAP